METDHDEQRIMAYIVRCERRPERILRDVCGFVMFGRGVAVEQEIETHLGAARCIDDLFDLHSDLPLDATYPAFMVWEGTVRFTDDDYFTSGKWRRARGAEVIACAQGRNPFPEAVTA